MPSVTQAARSKRYGSHACWPKLPRWEGTASNRSWSLRTTLSDSQWKDFASGANNLARTVKEQTGLRTVFHHHCAGYIETPAETARLLEMTEPDLLGLVFDTGHFLYGSGANEPSVALEFLERFADRIWYIHFKDCDPELASSARREKWDYFEAVRRG